KILAQNFDYAVDIEYDYEIPTGDLVINGNNKTYTFKTRDLQHYIFTTFTTFSCTKFPTPLDSVTLLCYNIIVTLLLSLRRRHYGAGIIIKKGAA
ncbi:MAG: hypothetical protein IIU63_08005, partial [Clostridia bacterium]|nr:hypothetical protein [Clostridia bacterium]